jgi:tetratricopeptide (TPR) repeat protein
VGADLDGDGTDEILLADVPLPAQLLVLRIESGALRKIDQLEFRSKCHYVITTDVEGDGREEFVLVFGEYSGWQALQIRIQDFGSALELRRLSPYRFLGPVSLVTGSDGKDRRLWLHNRDSGDDRRILKGITEPKYVLARGLYRLLPLADDAPEDFTPMSLGQKLDVGRIVPLNREGMVMAHVSLPDRTMALGLCPLNRGRSWALHPLPPGKRLGLLFGANLDDDPAREVVLEVGESLRVYGVGEPGSAEMEALLGLDSEEEDLRRLENPFLATALEMASMEWREEALGLFREAREVSVGLLEERRALLGEADCLVRLDRAEEAMKIYRAMIRTSAAGIAEELFSIVELLRQEGKWEAIYELVTEILDRVPLPREMERWAEETQANVEPLTRMTHRVPIIPVERFDPSYIADHPLKARRTDDGDAMVFHSDAARRACFGRIIQFGGGPLRIEASLELESLQWAAYLYVGLFRIQEKKSERVSSSGFWLAAESGRCTNIPAIMLKVPGATGWTVQEFPPALPTLYTFSLVYAPSMNHLSLKIRDETRGRTWEGGQKYSARLAPGKYCVALAGGSEHSTTMFQSRVTIRRFELTTASKANRPLQWEPAEGALGLARANAAIALGEPEKALAILGDLEEGTPEFYDACAIPYWDRRESDPRPEAKIKLVRAIAALRAGRTAQFEEALAAALEEDPAPVFAAVNAGFPCLSPGEQEAVGSALRKGLTAKGGALASRMADTFEKDVRRRPRNVSRITEPFRAAMANALRGIGRAPTPEFADQALAAFFSMWSRFMPSMMEAVFRSTPLSERARQQRLHLEAGNFIQAGDWAEAKRAYETILEEAPDDPTALNALAWFLVTSRVEALQNPAKARELAEKAIPLCEGPGSPHAGQLAGCLDTLARAHFLLGNVEEAVRTQERALANLRSDDPKALAAMEQALALYREALEGKKE